jgi:peptide/nickel transport system substrate-binding protein
MTPGSAPAFDRRAFLRGAAGLGGAVLLGACAPRRRASNEGPPVDVFTDPGSFPPAERPTFRLGGGALGFPSPFGYIAVPGYRQMSLIYDTLLWKDGSGRLLPWLASRYERSDDDLVYTFELRDNVRWHDGRPLTAEDVAFTFDYYRDNTLGPLVAFQPYGIEKVVAAGPTKVRIHLARPDVTFAEGLAGTIPIAPKHVWSSIDDPGAVQDLKMLVGSGPYRLASYNGDGEALLFSANNDYFLGRPFVQRIEMLAVSDELTSLLAGQLDAAEADETGTRPDVLAPFRGDGYGMLDTPGGFTFPLYWNVGKGGPLGDVRFRRACAHAIDRRDVVQRLTGGNGLPGNPGFLAPTNPFHVNVEQYPFDRAAANRLLDEAGFTRRSGAVRRTADGRELRFELLFPGQLAPLAEVVAAGLKEVGVELTLQSVPLGPALYGRKLAGDYEMALALYPGPSGPGPNADPDLLRPLFSSRAAKSLNSANGWVDKDFDQLAERQLATFDDGERRRMVGRMQEIVARDVPVLPLYYSTLFTVFRRSVFDQWYVTPGQFPVGGYNRQLFVTGVKTGTVIRPVK